MKKTLIKIIIYAVMLLALASFFYDYAHIREMNKALKSNQEILLSEKKRLTEDNRRYQIADSLNAITAKELQLTADQYKRYYNESLSIINKLRLDKMGLQKVIDMQANTLEQLTAKIRDTLVMRDTLRMLKTFNYTSTWTDVKGLIDIEQDTVSLDINNRESLIIVESVEYKRFLGFLWRTKRIKSRKVDIVSLNPNTVITNAEYKSIEKLN